MLGRSGIVENSEHISDYLGIVRYVMRVFGFGIRHVGGRRSRAARVDAGTRRAPFAGTVIHIVTGRRLLNFCAVRTQVDSYKNKLTKYIFYFIED